MKILVTGSKGQLGNKVRELLIDNYSLILTDMQDMDIQSKKSVHDRIKNERPEIILHLAAFTKVDTAEDQEEVCRKVNATGTKYLAEAAREINALLIYISTDYVFDGRRNLPYTEEDEPNPISVYGSTKMLGEEYVKEICPRYYIIRVSWLFGELPANHKGTNFIETMLRLGREREELRIVSDQIGSPTYTKDLVEIIKMMIVRRPRYGIYHFSGKSECSWYDFAKQIFFSHS